MNQSFPTSPANWFICYFAFHFLHIGWTGLFIILQICPTSMCFNTSVRCCSSLEFHVPFIFLYWNLMFPAYPFPYDCVSPILLQETDSFSQKANLLHKKYRANSQSLGNHRYHVRLESEIPENQTRKLLSPSLGPQVSICLQLSACLLYYSHSQFTDSVFCTRDGLFVSSFPESSGSWLHMYYIPISQFLGEKSWGIQLSQWVDSPGSDAHPLTSQPWRQAQGTWAHVGRACMGLDNMIGISDIVITPHRLIWTSTYPTYYIHLMLQLLYLCLTSPLGYREHTSCHVMIIFLQKADSEM